MKILIIGGNRFFGLRLSILLDRRSECDLHILNRTGQVGHTKNATVYKGDRSRLESSFLDRDWDVIIDFACFTGADARSSLEYFGKVGRYIFISTMSVYDNGTYMAESKFNPKTFNGVGKGTSKAETYQFGKREAEAVFTNESSFPTLSVRLPLVLGPDDYTHRLEFHVERIEKGQPIYFPNLSAQISMIHAQDAAEFLNWSVDRKISGPLNVASPDAIAIKDFVGMIERRVGRKCLLAPQSTSENHSPYGASDDFSLSVKAMEDGGYKIRPISAWLPDLIDSLASSDRSDLH